MCTVDYSFMDEVLGEDGSEPDEESDVVTEAEPICGSRLQRGTGQVFATKFVPPSADAAPLGVFTGRKPVMEIARFTLPNDAGKFLILTDGACLDNGRPNPKAGWAFWHGESHRGKCVASGRLENKGPFGEEGAQTSNRAELRAVLAALRFRHWPGERFHTCVIATDSVYVVEGCTNWARTWMRNGWTTRAGQPVDNKDMWEAVLGEIEKKHDDGMAVEFWRIARELNTVADDASRTAAQQEDAADDWIDVFGINI